MKLAFALPFHHAATRTTRAAVAPPLATFNGLYVSYGPKTKRPSATGLLGVTTPRSIGILVTRKYTCLVTQATLRAVIILDLACSLQAQVCTHSPPFINHSSSLSQRFTGIALQHP